MPRTNDTEPAYPWITVAFVPSLTHRTAYWLNNPDSTDLHARPVLGVLVQHQYDDTAPVDSRTVFSYADNETGELLPVNPSITFMGVCDGDDRPTDEDINICLYAWKSQIEEDRQATEDRKAKRYADRWCAS